MKIYFKHPYRNKFLWLIGFLVLLFIIVLAIKYSFNDRFLGNLGDGGEPAVVQKTEVPTEEFPEKLPADFPQEENAQVTQNYTAPTQDGRYTGVRVFESKKSLDENRQVYLDYLKKNEWSVGTDFSSEGLRVVSGVKDNLQIHVAINENSISKVVTVETTISEIPGQN